MPFSCLSSHKPKLLCLKSVASFGVVYWQELEQGGFSTGGEPQTYTLQARRFLKVLDLAKCSLVQQQKLIIQEWHIGIITMGIHSFIPY